MNFMKTSIPAKFPAILPFDLSLNKTNQVSFLPFKVTPRKVMHLIEGPEVFRDTVFLPYLPMSIHS